MTEDSRILAEAALRLLGLFGAAAAIFVIGVLIYVLLFDRDEA